MTKDSLVKHLEIELLLGKLERDIADIREVVKELRKCNDE